MIKYMPSKKTKISSPRTPKGFRDFLPEEAAKRKFVIGKIVEVLETFGFDPLETPALEYASLLEGKYGSEEKLIYKFQDRGGRQLALRYDQTVPLARIVAQYNHLLPSPFKRYQIQPAWRAEKPQAGRFRELTQCDFDIVGTSSPMADAETIAVINAVLTSLGFKKFHILFNDRRVLSKMIKLSGIKSDLELPTIRILDKIEKIGEIEVINELEKIGVAASKVESLMSILGKRAVLPKQKKLDVNLEEIDAITNQLKNFQVPSKKVLYTPTLARGLDYYTGIIIEASVQGYENGSVGGGGRYNNLIGMFSGKKTPAVGFSFGIDRLIEAMQQFNLLPNTKTTTKVLITIFDSQYLSNSANLATDLRNSGINSQLYLDSNHKLNKQIKYADKKGIPFVVIIGPDEIEANTVTVKNLKSGKQQTIPLEKLHNYLQS